MQFINLLFYLISIICLFSCSSEKNNLELGKLVLLENIVRTDYQICQPNQYKDSYSFQDAKNDVKAGSLNPVEGSIDFRDLIAGEISKKEDELILKMELGSIPDTILIHPLERKDIPEYKFLYSFFIEKEKTEITIGMILYPTERKEERIKLQEIPIEVFQNQKSIASCGYPIVTQKEMQIVCNLRSIPVLQKINSDSTFNVFVENYDGNYLFKDCY